MATLFDIMLHTARTLEALHEGLATGGAAATLLDSALPGYGWAAGDFDNGTLLWIKDINSTLGGSQSRIVSSFTMGTTFNVPAWSGTKFPEAGDTYGALLKAYPVGQIIGKVNEVLQELGEIVSTFDVAATGAQEYALADTYKRIHKIEIGDAAATVQRWVPHLLWRQTQGRLYFPQAIKSGYTIRIHYLAQPSILAADTDALNADFNADWVGLAAAVKCARWLLGRPGADEKAQTSLLNDLMVREAQLRPARRVYRIAPVNQLFPFDIPEH